MKIRFYVAFPKRVVSLILISVHWKSKRLRISSGLSLNPIYWDQKTEAVIIPKRKTEANREALETIASKLDSLKGAIKAFFYNATINNEEINLRDVAELIEKLKNPPVKSEIKSKLFLDYFDQFLVDRSQTTKFHPKTIIRLRTTYNQLVEFEKYIDEQIQFNCSNQSFTDSLVVYLSEEKKMMNNSIRTVLRNIITFIHYAVEKEWTYEDGLIKLLHKSIRDFNLNKNLVSQKPALTFHELDLLEKAELKPRLSNVRNLFLIQCYTGLRYSDLINLRPENFVWYDKPLRVGQKNYIYGVIDIITEKTTEHEQKPIHAKLMAVLKRFPNYQIQKISNQKFNDYLKQVCREAGIETLVQIPKFYGNKVVKETVPKWSLITTHTGRKTLSTLALSKNMTPENVMLITGHKNKSVFFGYVKPEQKKAFAEIANVF
ncbi:MAG: phage integrase SAM-like domain-containing protein [Candidatus Kapabacteria bacterium]|nr:phage integrase SAM-like domain-containing protein [Candidatus Kapabacteria bacterium]